MTPPVSLAIQNVSVALGGRTVIHHISSELEGGHLVALVGPNGVGKTTLLRAIAGLIPSNGDIRIDGDSLDALPLRERATRFGYLPQGHAVHWPLRVRDVVALGRYPHGATDPLRLAESDEAAVARAIKATDILPLAERKVTELSGGERSRVALARVLAVEAPVILADEPTASLDPRYQLNIMSVLRSTANGGALVIVVTHDLGLAARFADTVLVLSDGRLVAQGAPDHALSDSIMEDVFRVGAYRASFQNQSVIVPWANG
ncbi:MAG: ABC transporter ATP-binding protein [Afipia sp.]|nr:ABC transporter ATP-binding protein [Afipia sp.]